MSCNDYILSVDNISKCFEIYEKPSHRLWQMFFKNKKLYKEFWALNDISFKVKRGESVGIIGRNGAGKSTLLQIICNTLSPTDGQTKIQGKVAALLELGAGFNPEFSGRDNVYLCASLYGMTKEQIDERYEMIANFADIGDFINQPVKTYSSGMYVRLAFAVIAHVDADILIIDEALAVGDALFTQKCMRFLREFKKNGVLLFVSHDTSAVTNLCDKAVWLKNGKVESFDSAKIVSEKYMADLYQSKVTKNDKKVVETEKKEVKVFRDFRQDFINSSNLRNDIQIFQFDDIENNNFGKGGAKISDVFIMDEDGNALNWFVGGEGVTLRVEVEVNEEIKNPIVGFSIRDKLGQPVFGDNTFLHTISDNLLCNAGNKIVVDFDFQMPVLLNGDYSVTVAVADGDQNNHVQHHWINDALLFKSTATSASTGLVGIPMKNIKINII
ncbi:ABC transporter ATP-binding protein [Photobacterium ganghwense]|uniref:ABC transporter ATP-binding protein n=1 Tax=Photobacterium ganghwense TaxID=320778 RepID=A0A0J1K9G2_9GAMM|nr:ABC transporter ATP-binding protein [Photobacterium ganghwense]KLV10967.1 ABC transporter ATP-binding protein [Photobacterium ganghwense]PSU11228.1 ABC transporter ATP-binding protein [Photobacterium ganghwense]QSV13347.1 ABC transporter ATP-binding protein [Photobacterium ganghwense]